MPTGMLVDGYDLSQDGFITRSGIEGLRGTAEVVYPAQQVPGRIEAVRMSVEPQYQPRRLTVPAVVEGATLSAMRTNLQAVKRRLHPGPERAITFVDDQTVEFRARVLGIDGQGVQPDLSQPVTQLAVRMVCLDPRILAASDNVESFGATLTEMPLGAAPSLPVIRVSGASSFTLTYADHAGTTVKTMTLSGTFGGSLVDIDMANRTIVDGSGTNQADALTSGGFFALDPTRHGTPAGADPQLKVSAGSGQATYRKAW